MPARTDQVTDPALAAGLLRARRGQAYFSRALRDLSDDELDAPSLLCGWSRRHVVAHIGLNARALTRLTTWAATGVETPMYDSPTQRDVDIAEAATLPAQALRHLSDHAAIHLDVEWRDLPEQAWTAQVRTAQGRTVPVSATVWMRTREVWLHTVDLDHGARVGDFPPDLVHDLLADLIATWRRQPPATRAHLVLAPTDAGPLSVWDPTADAEGSVALADADADAETLIVTGTASDLVAWGTGRHSEGVTLADGSPAPAPPRWL